METIDLGFIGNDSLYGFTIASKFSKFENLTIGRILNDAIFSVAKIITFPRPNNKFGAIKPDFLLLFCFYFSGALKSQVFY
jgi:hypothetical protein